MPGSTQLALAASEQPRTFRFCHVCSKETPHQIRAGAGINAILCLPCLERVLHYELDRD